MCLVTAVLRGHTSPYTYPNILNNTVLRGHQPCHPAMLRGLFIFRLVIRQCSEGTLGLLPHYHTCAVAINQIMTHITATIQTECF